VKRIGILCASDTELAPFFAYFHSPDVALGESAVHIAGRSHNEIYNAAHEENSFGGFTDFVNDYETYMS